MSEITCLKCQRVCASLRGWKQHMSAAHGGYDDADLEAVAGGQPTDDVRSRMAAFAETLPEAGETAEDAGVNGGEKTAGTPAPAPLPDVKRVKATPKKLKKVLGNIPAKILESQQIELTDEDREALDEAGEFLADVFGVEFSVPESKLTVESRLFAFVWVAGVTLLIFLEHKFSTVFEMMKGKNDETTISN